MSTSKNNSQQVRQAVFMTDASEPHISKMVSEDDNEPEKSDYEDLFEEKAEEGWVEVTSERNVPSVHSLKDTKDQQQPDHYENAKRKLRHELTVTIPAVAEAAQVIGKVSFGLLAEGLGYILHETRETVLSNLPTLQDLNMATALRRDKATMDEYNLPRNHPNRLAASWKYPPSLGVRDPRDAPPGSNLDGITMIGTEPVRRGYGRRDGEMKRYNEIDGRQERGSR